MAESTITFREITDKNVFAIVEPESNRTLAEIVGYGVSVNFNMEEIHTQEDIDSTSEAIGRMFKNILISSLLRRKG